MKKTAKRIPVNEFEMAARSVMDDKIECEWNGVKFLISPTLSLNQVLEFVANVTESCFDDSGNYIPEILDFAIKCNIVEKYTNITLPRDMKKQFDLLCATDICDCILQYINVQQYNSMIRAIERKLKYMSEARVTEIHAEIRKIVDAFTVLQERMSNAIDNMSGIDLEELMKKFSDFNESGIVKEYAEEIKKWAETNSAEENLE